MTTEEKRQRIKDNCVNCMFCPLYEALEPWEHCHKEGADIETNYKIMFEIGKGELHDQSETDIQACQEHSDG